MNALIRWGAGLLSLLLLGSTSHARVWISPVFKTPLPHAPSPSNSGFYLVDACGRLTGPHYFLVPPCAPFNGMLPGPTGMAIQQGNLPHTLLLSQEGLAIGNVPQWGPNPGHGASSKPYPGPGAGMPQFAGGGPLPYQMAGGSNGMPGPYVQIPYGNMPRSPYPMQSPYPQPMPMAPYSPPSTAGYMPNQPQVSTIPARPVAYMPYYGPPGMYATARQDPRTGIWQVQNVMPNQGPLPFMPIPGFKVGTAGPQGMQKMPMMPGMEMGPGNGFQNFGPVQQFDQFGRLQGPQSPQMNWAPMELPRMDMMPPPPRPGMAYPTHPFTRSPRDFFMWGENMDDERARSNRPFPVP
jgi:hypothetical protein